MSTFILNKEEITDVNKFVRFWKEFYEDSYKTRYDDVINKSTWEAADIHLLFEWKNNMSTKLSPGKEVFVKRIIDNLSLVNDLRRAFIKDVFMDKFEKSGPVWSITLLHAVQPTLYPIYDQHAHRAYSYISEGSVGVMPTRNKVYTMYFRDYVPFFESFSESANAHSPKSVDEALWSFGKFLSIYPKIP